MDISNHSYTDDNSNKSKQKVN